MLDCSVEMLELIVPELGDDFCEQRDGWVHLGVRGFLGLSKMCELAKGEGRAED